MRRSIEGDDDESLPLDTTTVMTPEGELLSVQYRGARLGLQPGSAEYKREKRLADNRASAARSRALQRARVTDIEVRL